jgi:hypothetical protein
MQMMLSDGKFHDVFVLDEGNKPVLVSVDHARRRYFPLAGTFAIRHKWGALTREGIRGMANKVLSDWQRDESEGEAERARWSHEGYGKTA